MRYQENVTFVTKLSLEDCKKNIKKTAMKPSWSFFGVNRNTSGVNYTFSNSQFTLRKNSIFSREILKSQFKGSFASNSKGKTYIRGSFGMSLSEIIFMTVFEIYMLYLFISTSSTFLHAGIEKFMDNPHQQTTFLTLLFISVANLGNALVAIYKRQEDKKIIFKFIEETCNATNITSAK